MASSALAIYISHLAADILETTMSTINLDKNIIWHAPGVNLKSRAYLLKQHPITLWLTGLSGAGKSTLAFALEAELIKLGHACFVLDGDNVRHGLNRDLGFSAEDRQENIRRIAEVAKLMNAAGLIVIASFISPYCSDRQAAREIIGTDNFREVYISTSLSACEQRDVKGLYQKAREGLIAEFTGISSPYEPPLSPDLSLDTAEVDIDQAVAKMIALIQTRLAV
jgi:adenylylsulfate kinase